MTVSPDGSFQKFFELIENKGISEPHKVAVEFSNFFRRNLTNTQGHEASRYSISLSVKDTSLDFLTKRLTLIADKAILSHQVDKSTKGTQKWIIEDNSDGSDSYDTFFDEYYLVCPNPSELGQWIIQCKELLLNSQAIYYPTIMRDEGWGMGESNFNQTIFDPVDAIVDSRDISEILTTDIIKSRLIRPITKLEIPYIEDVDLKTFSRITMDEKQSLDRFRDLLRSQLIGLKEYEGSEHFDENLVKIGIDIRDSVRVLDHELKSIQRKKAFQVTGAGLAMTTAMLVAINKCVIDYYSELIGSGGLYLLSKAIEESNLRKFDAENSPFYYLWLFSK